MMSVESMENQEIEKADYEVIFIYNIRKKINKNTHVLCSLAYKLLLKKFLLICLCLISELPLTQAISVLFKVLKKLKLF